jgi:hypothetical protein
LPEKTTLDDFVYSISEEEEKFDNMGTRRQATDEPLAREV